ncbi:hypothetical protein ACQ4LE_005373 [Meloidogyne hapla]
MMVSIELNFVAATIEEEIQQVETNLLVDSAVHKCWKDSLEKVLKLFGDDIRPVTSQNTDELIASASALSSEGIVGGLISHLSRSFSLNESSSLSSQTRSAPSSPSGSRPGGAKQYFRSVSFNEPIQVTTTSSAPSSPGGRLAGGVIGFVRQLSLNATSQLPSPSGSSSKSYSSSSSFNFKTNVLVSNAITLLEVEIPFLRGVLDKIYQTFKDIPNKLKETVPYNLRDDHFPEIINRQLLSDIEIWLMRVERISKENPEFDLCRHFNPNQKRWIQSELNYLLADKWSWPSNHRDPFNNESVENKTKKVVKNMRIYLGIVAVKAYQINVIFRTATIVCNKHLFEEYDENIRKIRNDHETELENAVKLQEIIHDASIMLSLLKKNKLRNNYYYKNNKHVVELHKAYDEKCLNLAGKPTELSNQKNKFDDIIKERIPAKKVEWHVWKDIAEIIQLEGEIVSMQLTVSFNPVTPLSSPRKSPRELPPQFEVFSPKSLPSFKPNHHLLHNKHFDLLNLIKPKDVDGGSGVNKCENEKNHKGKEKMKGVNSSAINKPTSLKLASLDIPRSGQSHGKSKLKRTHSKISPPNNEENNSGLSHINENQEANHGEVNKAEGQKSESAQDKKLKALKVHVGSGSKDNDQTMKFSYKGKAKSLPSNYGPFNKESFKAKENEHFNPEANFEQDKEPNKERIELKSEDMLAAFDKNQIETMKDYDELSQSNDYSKGETHMDEDRLESKHKEIQESKQRLESTSSKDLTPNEVLEKAEKINEDLTNILVTREIINPSPVIKPIKDHGAITAL